MAVLVKVNGLEAYMLLDSGSTTISVTHNFAQVVRLHVMQLQHPVLLQLGMVRSHSMINFGAKACLELGPACEDAIYIDIVNIDQYNMIIGTPFMHKHGLALDFEKDILMIQGMAIPMLSLGQENLMLAKKWLSWPHAPEAAKGVAHMPQ